MMDVGRESGLPKEEQVHLREAEIVLQAHTYPQRHCYGGRDAHKRGTFRGHPGGQKVEVPLAKATTLATCVPASNDKTGKLHMHTHFYSDQETGSIRRH
jgi:hypothetical protein